MISTFARMIRNDDGATLVEYSLVVALIAVVAIGAITTLGSNIKTLFTTLGDKVNGANTTASSAT